MSEDVQPYGAHDDAAARTNELRTLVTALGWSQRAAARELEVDERTMRYWFAANPAPPKMALFAMRFLVVQMVQRGQGAPVDVDLVINTLVGRTATAMAVNTTTQGGNYLASSIHANQREVIARALANASNRNPLAQMGPSRDELPKRKGS